MIKIDIISGFLGSGKTTFIRKLLEVCQEKNERVVLIENEFGDIGIDGEIIRRNGFEVFEISKGCVCCSMKNDFIFTLTHIIETIKPDRILFEPSGIFIPTEILSILRMPEFSSKCVLNSLVSIVDCENFIKQSSKYSMFFEKQIESANLIVVSKVQEINKNQVGLVFETLSKINPSAQILIKDWAFLSNSDLQNILNPSISDDLSKLITNDINELIIDDFNALLGNCKAKKEVPTQFQNHSEDFDTLSIKVESFIDKQALTTILSKLKSADYGEVLRAKGFLKSVNGFLEFSYVDGDFQISEKKSADYARACVIGKTLNESGIISLFAEIDNTN